MVQKGKARIEGRLHGDDEHARGGESEVEDDDRRQEEEQDGKEDGSDEQLVQIVVARVNAVAEHVPLLATEEVEEGDDYRELPVEDARGRDVEGVDVDCED